MFGLHAARRALAAAAADDASSKHTSVWESKQSNDAAMQSRIPTEAAEQGSADLLALQLLDEQGPSRKDAMAENGWQR